MVQVSCKLCTISFNFSLWEEHIRTSHHMKKLPPKIVVTIRSSQQSKIKEVDEYFSKFSCILKKNVVIKEGKLVLHYTLKEKKVYTEIIHQEHILFGQKLEITWPDMKAIPSSQTGSALENLVYQPLGIINSLKEVRTVSEQMTIFQNKLKINSGGIKEIREMIQSDLTEVFSQYKIHLIDSAFTDLQILGSCFDIFIDVKEEKFPDVINSLKELVLESTKFSRFIQGQINKIYLVRWKHVKTGIWCLLNLNHECEKYNRELIDYYLTLDEKLTQFFTLILAWGECNDLRKQVYFSNYSLQLMMIFYLQQEPYKLPTVIQLQKKASNLVINGWNYSFTSIDYTNSTLRNTSLLELVSGFFKFYDSFDYFSYLISPYFGSLIKKSYFLKPLNLPQSYNQYMNQSQVLAVDAAICVQDPFEHSRNVAVTVPFSNVAKFTSFCRTNFKLIRLGESGLLYTLFSGHSPEEVLTFNIRKDNELGEAQWIKLVKEVLMKVLTDIFACTVAQAQNNRSDRVTYATQTQYNIWENRLTTLQQVLPDLSQMEKEIIVTKRVKVKLKNPSSWETNFQLTFNGNICKLRMYTAASCMHNCRPYFDYLMVKLKKLLLEEKICRVGKKATAEVSHASPKYVEENTPGILQTTYKDFKDLEAEVVQSIKRGSSFAEQISILRKEFQIDTPTLEKNLKAIYIDLTSVLSSAVFKNKIFFFGSSTIGLHTRCSNLDVCIDVESEQCQAIEVSVSKSNCFDGVQVLTGSEISVVRCKHIKTEIICDLNIRNKLPVANSKLIKNYVKLDVKIGLLMIVIKFWAKLYRVVGIDSFSSYAVYLMVIFYLQQEYKLPSVNQLQENTSEVINGWNCGFTPIKFTSEALNSVTTADLIKGFFKFYINFDYISYIISPYLGLAIEKVQFLQPNNLTSKFKQYKKQKEVLVIDSHLCIQDPFEHSRNVVASGSLACQRSFISLCGKAYCLMITMKEPHLLHEILIKGAIDNTFYLDKNQEQDKNDWMESVKQLTLEITTKVFGCTVEKELRDGVNVFQCYGYLKIWEDRDNVLKKILPSLPIGCSDIEKEVAITSFIVQNYSEKPKDHIWRMSLELIFNEDSCRAFFIEKTEISAGKSFIDHILRVKLGEFIETKRKELDERNKMQLGGTVTKKSKNRNRSRQDRDIRRRSRWAELLHSVCVPSSTDHSCGGNFIFLKLLAESVQITPNLTEQVAILQSKLQEKKIEVRKNVALIFKDLTAVLSPSFPSLEISLYESGLTDFNVCDNVLHVYINSQDLELIKTLLSSTDIFSNIWFISPEMIACQHVKSGTGCYLKMENKVLKESVKLIEYYSGLDEKIKPLMLMIEIWADCYKLELTSFCPKYDLLIMVIFYLQQNPYNVPSAMCLQNKTGSEATVEFSALKEATLLELLTGFFKLYSKFDYVSYIISPYFGSAIEKVQFLTPASGIQNVKMRSGVCIQDPFGHAENLISYASLCQSGKFGIICETTLRLIEQGEGEFIPKLLLHVETNDSIEFQIEKDQRDYEEWKQSIKNLTVKILTEILNLKCSEVETSEQIVYECSGQNNVWINRTEVSEKVSSDLSEIDREIAITSLVLKQSPQKTYLQFTVNVDFQREPGKVVVFFTGKEKTTMEKLYHYIHFFHIRLSKFLENEVSSSAALEEIEANLSLVRRGSSSSMDIETDQEDSNEIQELIDTTLLDMSSIQSPNRENSALEESPNSVKLAEEGEVEEEDDVPSDFFDDFAKEEFLDGLDIVNFKMSGDTEKKEKKRSRGRTTSKDRKNRSRKRSRSRSRSVSRRKRSKSRSVDRIKRDKTEEKNKRKRSSSKESRSSSNDSRRREENYRARKRSNSLRRSYSRSPSPYRRSRGQNIKNRKSFLEEIRDKLNEVGSPFQASSPINYSPNYIQPVPPPVVSVSPLMSIPPPSVSVPTPVPPPVPFIPTSNVCNNNWFLGISLTSTSSATVESEAQTNQGIHENLTSKLFAEKKISLSDYLTITTKHKVKYLNPEELQEKLKVISLCQDAIIAMSNQKGRFIIKPSPEPIPQQRTPHQSPLSPPVKFKFTSVLKKSDCFETALHDILQKIGLFSTETDVYKLIDSVAEALSTGVPMNKEIMANILKISLLGSKKCSVRPERKQQKAVGTQCLRKEYVSVGVQISEEVSPAKGLINSDTILYLTTAYLLGRENRPGDEERPLQRI